jgi:hypothetical protein
VREAVGSRERTEQETAIDSSPMEWRDEDDREKGGYGVTPVAQLLQLLQMLQLGSFTLPD